MDHQMSERMSESELENKIKFLEKKLESRSRVINSVHVFFNNHAVDLIKLI